MLCTVSLTGFGECFCVVCYACCWAHTCLGWVNWLWTYLHALPAAAAAAAGEHAGAYASATATAGTCLAAKSVASAAAASAAVASAVAAASDAGGSYLNKGCVVRPAL